MLCVRSHCRESSRCSVEARGSSRVSVRQWGSPSGWASHRHPAAQYRNNHLICQQRPSSSLLPDPASKRIPRGEVGSWQIYSRCTLIHSLCVCNMSSHWTSLQCFFFSPIYEMWDADASTVLLVVQFCLLTMLNRITYCTVGMELTRDHPIWRYHNT